MTDRSLSADMAAHGRRETGQPEPAPAPRFAVALRGAEPEWAWGFDDWATTQRFAAFVAAEIDPVQILTAPFIQDRPNLRWRDPVQELLAWREASRAWMTEKPLANVVRIVKDGA
jgi:hypothetical protein